MPSKPKTLTLEIICLDKAEVIGDREEGVSGWGEDSSETVIKGQVRQLLIRKDGEDQVCIGITDDGSIIITDCGAMCYKSHMPDNFRLVPSRPWEDES